MADSEDAAPEADPRLTVLHYTGYDEDVGGVLSVIRALADADRFTCVLGTNRGFVQRRTPALEILEFPTVSGDRIGPLQAWHTRDAALAICAWLRADPARLFHGHSRAGLLVALWLRAWGEDRAVASVHCYGRHRWFYRWAAGRLGDDLFWLSPAMRRYYGVTAGDGWAQCIPGGVPRAQPAAVTAAPGRLRLGGAGSLVGWKNWALVIDAIARLPDSVQSRVTFHHIGEGTPDAISRLQRLIARHRLHRQVVLLGPEASPRRLFSCIDCLVIASKNEPFSMSMLEALAAGIPVLAADSGGATDIIDNLTNGRLFRTGDAGSLADVIRAWVECPPAHDPAQITRTSVQAADVALRWLTVYSSRTAASSRPGPRRSGLSHHPIGASVPDDA